MDHPRLGSDGLHERLVLLVVLLVVLWSCFGRACLAPAIHFEDSSSIVAPSSPLDSSASSHLHRPPNPVSIDAARLMHRCVRLPMALGL